MHLTAITRLTSCKNGLTSRQKRDRLQILRVMKITAVLLTAACLQVAARTEAQRVTIDMKNAPVQKVFTEVIRQSGVSIIYNEALFKDAALVTIQLKDATVEEVLEKCLAGQPFVYSIENNMIVVKQRDPNTTSSSIGPPIDISGKVTDSEGKPLFGATVKVKGRKLSVTTDINGVFVVKGVDEDAILEVSYAEHETLAVKVASRTSFIVTLKRQITSLNEVVVNKGYYTEKARFSVGNVTTVKAADIEKQPVRNPLLALQGRVPGLEVTQLTGTNGGAVRVRIQGRNSIHAGLEPLIVIDGVPYPSQLNSSYVEQDIFVRLYGGSPLNYVNPADIESIDVLKDADATAIYGTRAANGAILITTKKGKIGKSKLSINIQQGWGKVTRKVDMMNTREYLDMRYEAYRNDGINWSTQSPNSSNYDLKLWDTTRYTDWQKTLIGGTAEYTKFGASISGGTATMQYLIAGNFNRQTTVFPGNFDDKNGGLHFNINGSSADQKLRIALSSSYSYDRNHLPGTDLTEKAILLAPNAPALFNEDGTLNWAPNAAGSSSWENPLVYMVNVDFTSKSRSLVSHMNLSYNILPGFEFRSNFGYTDLTAYVYKPYRLEFYPPEQRPFVQRSSIISNRFMRSWIVEPQLQYSNHIANGKIDGLVGVTFQQNSTDLQSLIGYGYSSDLLMKSILAATSVAIRESNSTMYRYGALFGRLNYNWDNEFLINLTARQDWSSRFGDKNKFHTFYSLGFGWIFSEQKWLREKLPFLSFGKLRVSYGTTGNDQIADYSHLSLYYTTGGWPYQEGTGLSVTNIPNPHLQWELTRKCQGGIDLGFINDRILINATYARNRSSNQLIGYITPSITGFAGIAKNFPATIQNTSWEFMINTINVKRKDFSWTSSVNFTIPRNKVVRFPNIELTSYAGDEWGVVVGQPLGIMKTYRYFGIDPATGYYLAKDKDGNPTSTPSQETDRTAWVSMLTNWYGGLQSSFSYKGLQLDFLFQFVRTRGIDDLVYWNGNRNPGRFVPSASNQPVSVLDRWQNPGDLAPIGRYSTRRMDIWPLVKYSYDASYMRLKNVSLSWQLPADWLKKAGLQQARFYFQGQNLATISRYRGLDPESMNLNSLPPLQMWTVGVQAEF